MWFTVTLDTLDTKLLFALYNYAENLQSFRSITCAFLQSAENLGTQEYILGVIKSNSFSTSLSYFLFGNCFTLDTTANNWLQ